MDAMDFSVNTRAVAGLADALDRRAHDLTGAASYLELHGSLRFGAGISNELFQTHEQIMATVQAFLRHVGDDYAERYALEVGQAVNAYLGTDRTASARLDATLPGVIDPSVAPHLADQSVGPEIFGDGQWLQLATPPDFRAEYPYQPHWYDLLSPSSVPRDAIWYVTGFLAKLGLLPYQCDPYETFTLPLCGDWAGLERVSFALTEVARTLAYVSARLDEEATALDRVWTGHAASGCRSALRRLANDLRPAQDIVIEIAAQYHEVAVAAREHAEALGALASMLFDTVSSLGVDLGIELGADLLGDSSRLARIASTLGKVIGQGKTIIEALHLLIEGKEAHLDTLCHQVGLLTPRAVSVNLPDDMPVLPVPARVGHR